MPHEETVAALSESINVSQPIARALCNRGISTYNEAKEFFRPVLSTLHSPWLFNDMERAVERLVRALKNGETILLYGDYDVDGTTGVALLLLFLRHHGVEPLWHINDRFAEGYGLSPEGIDRVIASGTTLLITVDCGIKDHAAIRRCGEHGVEVIVCDHHEADVTPEAYAILNPKVVGSGYPFRELCGCAVAFKLVQALAERLGDSEAVWHQFLDLVAVATAADLVSLTGENRTLVIEGLQQMRSKPRKNFSEMFRVMKVSLGDVRMFHLAFGIAPRINAAGRMHSAHLALEWLLASAPDAVEQHTEALERVNVQRRSLDSTIMSQADKMVESHCASYCSSIVLYDEAWHLGVLGIVASKLIDKYYLPTVVLGGMNGLVRGSVRSIEGLNIHAVLQHCSHHLEQFGGHHQAAGLTLKPENLAVFRKAFDEQCANQLTIEQRQKVMEIDAVVELEQITDKFIAVLEQFAPYGIGNREPLFMSERLQLAEPARLLKERHVKFAVRDKQKRRFEVIGFNRPDIYNDLRAVKHPTITMLYTIERRQWNGMWQVQLLLKDLEVQR